VFVKTVHDAKKIGATNLFWDLLLLESEGVPFDQVALYILKDFGIFKVQGTTAAMTTSPL
jgi:hypothetical protein